jgi:hypothetical protein
MENEPINNLISYYEKEQNEHKQFQLYCEMWDKIIKPSNVIFDNNKKG